MPLKKIFKNSTLRPYPHYTSTQPVFTSLNQAKVVIGLNDSYISQLYLSVCHLDAAINAKGQTPSVELKKIANSFKITTDLNPKMDLFKYSSKANIVFTFSVIEPLVVQLSEEYRQLNRAEWQEKPTGKKLDKLNTLIENLPYLDRANLKANEQYQVLEYYRAVRNHFAHGETDTTDVDNAYDKIKLIINPNKNLYGLKAPNKYNDITFDDFLLYTRCFKYFLLLLNDACELTVRDIFNIYMSDAKRLKTLRNAKNSKGRIEDILNGLSRKYELSDKHKSDLENLFNAFLKNDPVRKVRKKAK